MESVVRSIWGSYLQSNELLGIPHDIKEFSTLNEKFAIQSGIAIPPGTYPKVQYFCIGNGGHQMTMGTDNIPLTKINQHKATDAALFKHLPFVLRTVDNDLTPVERAEYALRKEEVYNGVTYIAYYLRRIDMSAVVSQIDYRSVLNGVITSTPYVPSTSSLSPTPTLINPTGVNVLAGDYITTTAMVTVSFTEQQVAELLNVANIIFADDNYAIISEIGLCCGADKVINVTSGGGGSFNFNEAIGVQVISFISSMHIAKYTTAGIEKFLDIGCNEPLLNII